MNIYKSSGQYIGFVNENNVFRWDGEHLGWIDNQSFIWDISGNFRGQLIQRDGYAYAIRSSFLINPVSKPPRSKAIPLSIPTPSAPAPVFPISVGIEDAF